MLDNHRLDRFALVAALLVVCSVACQPLSVAPTAPEPLATASNAPLSATPAPSATSTETARPPTATTPPTAQPPTPTTAPQLEIARLNSGLAADNIAHVFGEVRNLGAKPLANIKLRLEVPGHDATAFAPALDIISAGQSAPFDVPLPEGVAPLEAPKIAISAYAPANVETAQLSAQQIKRVDPGDGQLYLNGQLANDGTQPVQVYGIAAAVLDQAGLVQGVGQVAALVHYLAPGQRVPFSIILPGAQQDSDQFAVYLDARPVKPAGYALTATLTNAYHDECGCFRLAGQVTNSGSQALIVPLVAAVYDAQGGLLLVQAFSTTLPVAPGAPLPFGVSFGASVSSGIAPGGATVQVDLAGVVAPPEGETVPLPAAVLDMSQTQWELSFNSEITNTSSQTLTSIDVIAAAYAKNGRLVAAEPINVSPADGGALAPGAAFALNATLLLDGADAPKSLKLVLLARGRWRGDACASASANCLLTCQQAV